MTVNNDPYPQSNENKDPNNLPNYDNTHVDSASQYVPFDSYNLKSEEDQYEAKEPQNETWNDNSDSTFSNSSPYDNPYANSTHNQDNNYVNNTYPAPQNSEMNIKAILGVVFSIFFFPVGLILSWLGYRESVDKKDETGRILSIIGLAISGVQVAMIVLSILFFILMIFIGIAAG